MNDEELYKSMLAFAKAYSDALKPLNSKTMRFFSSDAVSNALKTFSVAAKLSIPKDSPSPEILQEIQSISHSYTQLMDEYKLGSSMSKSLNAVVADLQVNTMLQLSQSLQTEMVQNLSACFANADYNGLIDIINDTLARPHIEAPDIAFIKTSKLIDSIKKELVLPRGFSSVIKALNKSTAEGIADNSEIVYDTGRKLFISGSGDTDAQGLNIISSGKDILTQTSKELFSESELIDFMTVLSTTPMLALSVETGKKIFELLNELFLNGEKSIGFDRPIFFHCRSHKSDVMPFTYDQMLKAPCGLPWAGRFNQVGRSHYYFADSQNGAEVEVKKHLATNDVLQTVKLRPKKEIRLLDLSGTLARGATFLRYLRFKLSDVTDKMPREYLIPCFVSDCCKKVGFDGIKYYGSIEYSNYVAWNDGYFEYAGMCD